MLIESHTICVKKNIQVVINLVHSAAITQTSGGKSACVCFTVCDCGVP